MGQTHSCLCVRCGPRPHRARMWLSAERGLASRGGRGEAREPSGRGRALMDRGAETHPRGHPVSPAPGPRGECWVLSTLLGSLPVPTSPGTRSQQVTHTVTQLRGRTGVGQRVLRCGPHGLSLRPRPGPMKSPPGLGGVPGTQGLRGLLCVGVLVRPSLVLRAFKVNRARVSPPGRLDLATPALRCCLCLGSPRWEMGS